MEKKRIIWVDDYIETPRLVPYIDEFEDNGIEIIKVKSVDGLLETIKQEMQNSLSAILVDIIMPPVYLDFGETRGGLRTGIVVLNEILKEEILKSIPKIAVTNSDDSTVSDFCNRNSIPCLKKNDYFSDTFVSAVLEIIEGKNKVG